MAFTLERRVSVPSKEHDGVRKGWTSAFDEVLAPLLAQLT